MSTDERRFQVFLSSTYEDLQAERAAVIQSLLELKCLPLAMDFFPAASEPPWGLIAREIDSCDYFILILAGRYGSLDPTGMGYTEREYRYAVQQGKPILAFVCKDLDKLPGARLERTDDGRRRLLEFRQAVMGGQLIQFFSDAAELGRKTSVSMMRLMSDYPAAGWVRRDNGQAGGGALCSISDCAKELIDMSSRCEPEDEMTIEAVGLDMSIACDYVADAIRVCRARTLRYNILLMPGSAEQVGPLAPDDVLAWASYVDGSVRRITNGVRNAIRTRAANDQHLQVSLRQYSGLPVVHGTIMRSRQTVNYCSICRFRRSEETYDWGEFAYRRVVDGVGAPSDVHLAVTLEGLFMYLWPRSVVRWECESRGKEIVRGGP